MKKADLEKSLGKKIRGQMQHAAIPSRFGDAANAVPDRREQRKLDQAAGLVPFAVKLHEDLVRRLHELAAQEAVGLNELTARLIQAALPTRQPVAAKPAAQTVDAAPTKTAARKKAAVTPAGDTSVATKAATQPAAKKAAAKTPAAKKTAAKRA